MDKIDRELANYGPGVVVYFDLQIKLIKLFCVLSLFSIGMMVIYAKIGGWQSVIETDTLIQKTSFGNMGFPRTYC